MKKKNFYKRFLKIVATSILGTIYASSCLGISLPAAEVNKEAKYFILSIDGGGIRGIIPARILQEIENRTGKSIYQLFDFMVGTSTGGIIVSTLAVPNEEGAAKYKAEDLISLYSRRGKEIFSRSLWRKIHTGFGLWGARYDREPLDLILKEMLGDTLLSEALKPIMLISYSIDLEKGRLWTTTTAKGARDEDFYLRDVAGATSAAPTYFEPKLVRNLIDKEVFYEADGGIFANNPAALALTEARKMEPALNKDNIVIISIGTGKAKLNRSAEALIDSGIVGWVVGADLIDVMMSLSSEMAEWQSSILNLNTIRIQLSINDDLGAMDDTSSENIAALMQATEECIREHSAKIDNLCKVLLRRTLVQRK